MPPVYPSSAATGTSASVPLDVCIVEDEPEIVELVREVLDDAGISAEGAPMGWESHAFIRRRQPHLVILDVLLPSVDGVRLFHRLQADPATQHIPVIFCTANPRWVHDRLPNFRELGAALLSKPFDIGALVELVETVLVA